MRLQLCRGIGAHLQLPQRQQSPLTMRTMRRWSPQQRLSATEASAWLGNCATLSGKGGVLSARPEFSSHLSGRHWTAAGYSARARRSIAQFARESSVMRYIALIEPRVMEVRT